MEWKRSDQLNGVLSHYDNDCAVWVIEGEQAINTSDPNKWTCVLRPCLDHNLGPMGIKMIHSDGTEAIGVYQLSGNRLELRLAGKGPKGSNLSVQKTLFFDRFVPKPFEIRQFKNLDIRFDKK